MTAGRANDTHPTCSSAGEDQTIRIPASDPSLISIDGYEIYLYESDAKAHHVIIVEREADLLRVWVFVGHCERCFLVRYGAVQKAKQGCSVDRLRLRDDSTPPIADAPVPNSVARTVRSWGQGQPAVPVTD